MKQLVEIRASADSEMWELWHGTHLFAVIHADMFSFPIMALLEDRRAHGDISTLFKLEPVHDVPACTITQ